MELLEKLSELLHGIEVKVAEILVRQSAHERENNLRFDRLEKDATTLFDRTTYQGRAIAALEKVGGYEDGVKRGVGSTLGWVKWVVGTVVAVLSLFGGVGLSCIMR